MNSLKTLYYLGTAVPSLRLYPLFLLFQNLHFLAPVEPDPVADSRESADSFINWGFCQVHTPLPLGPDRLRFKRLLADITSRGPDYAQQLTSLTLASITERGPEESERAIATSLLSQPAAVHSQEKKEEKDLLWQARLVLAIGELLDREEEDVALSLAMFEDNEKRLFQELLGEDDGEEIDSLLGGLARHDVERRGNSLSSLKQRSQAWKTLFSTMGDVDFPMLLTRTKESGEILREAYEQRTGRGPIAALTLPLPTVVAWSSVDAEQALRRFIDASDPTLAAFTSYFQTLLNLDLAQAAEVPPPCEPQHLKTWQRMIDCEFPAERFGRSTLTIHLFPGLPTASMLSKPERQRSGCRNGLLAVLS